MIDKSNKELSLVDRVVYDIYVSSPYLESN